MFLASSLSHVQPSARSSPTFCHASSPVPSKSKRIGMVPSRSQTNKHPSQSRLNVTGCYMPRKLWRPEVFPSHIPFTMAPLPPPPRGHLASSPVGLALQKGTASPAPSSVPTQVPETTSAAPSSVPGPALAANPFRGLRAGTRKQKATSPKPGARKSKKAKTGEPPAAPEDPSLAAAIDLDQWQPVRVSAPTSPLAAPEGSMGPAVPTSWTAASEAEGLDESRGQAHDHLRVHADRWRR